MIIRATESILRATFPPCFIKVAKEKAHLEELISGTIYMKASGYYRNLDDNYRGDPYDGRCPVDPKLVRIVIEDPGSGESLFLDKEHGAELTELSYGFVGDDRIPMFCMTKLNPDILSFYDDYSYVVTRAYVNEMTKFGDFFTIINAQEFIERINSFNSSNSDKLIGKSVNYYSLEEMTRYSILNSKNKIGFESFFKKLDSYRYQNEWRMILNSDRDLFEDGKDFVKKYIGGPLTAKIFPIELLGKMQFKINKIEE